MATLTGEESLCPAMAGDESVSSRAETRGQALVSRLAEMTADIVRASLDRHDRGPRPASAAGGRLPALY
jgi:hypothetical protein